MKCPECGNYIKKGANFCGNCGAKVIAAIQEEERDIVAQGANSETIDMENKKANVDETIKGTDYNGQEIPVNEEADIERTGLDQEKSQGKEVQNQYLKKGIKIIGLIVLAIIVCGSKFWGRNEAQKKDLISRIQDYATTNKSGDAYVFKFDKPIDAEILDEAKGSLVTWSFVYKKEKPYIEFEDELISIYAELIFGKDGLSEEGKFQYDWNENEMRLGLNWNDEDNMHFTDLRYRVTDDKFTITTDGKSYDISTELQEYLDTYDFAVIMKDDLEIIKRQLERNKLSYRDLIRLKYTDIEEFKYIIFPDGELLTEANKDQSDDNDLDEEYFDQRSGILPVTLENIKWKDQVIGGFDFGGVELFYDEVNGSETDYKATTFHLYCWDKNMLPIDSDDSAEPYLYKFHSENVAANSVQGKSITFDFTDGIAYYIVFLAETEDFDGNIWKNPMNDYVYEQYAGKKLDLDTMIAFPADAE